MTDKEKILTFLGIKFIDYKGRRCSDGHVTARTVGDIKNFFGKDIQTTGQYIEDIQCFNFENNYEDLMFLVGQIETKKYFGKEISIKITKYSVKIQTLTDEYGIVINPCIFSAWGTSGGIDKKIAIYKACLEFVNWSLKSIDKK